MKTISGAILALGLLGSYQAALAQTLSRQAAVALAEKFVVENGYTSAASSHIKSQIDLESIERTDDRNKVLRGRYGTLQPKAIGAKRARTGGEPAWSVAFDYVPGPPWAQDVCRVVTMAGDGSNIRIEHVDGIRKAFAGFD